MERKTKGTLKRLWYGAKVNCAALCEEGSKGGERDVEHKLSIKFLGKSAEKNLMVYDGAFMTVEAFPALFSSRIEAKMEGKSTWELSASCGVRKGIIRLNLAEWRLKNTFSFVFFTVFILFFYLLYVALQRQRRINIYIWWIQREAITSKYDGVLQSPSFFRFFKSTSP